MGLEIQDGWLLSTVRVFWAECAVAVISIYVLLGMLMFKLQVNFRGVLQITPITDYR